MKQRIKYYNTILQNKPLYKEIAERLLENRETTKQEELYVKVLAPALIEFVSWVLEEAVRFGKERLYFLARDGYQMYLVAKQLCEMQNIAIQCRYLKVSRYALRVPEYHLLGEDCLERICIGGIDVTFRRIMKRAGLTEEEALEIAKSVGWLEDFDRILNYQEVMQLKKILRQQSKLFEYIEKHSRNAYPFAMGYLQQEGLLDNVSYALVDSGWVGTLQQTLCRLVGNGKVEGFYFGVYEIPKGQDKNRYHSFYFGPKWGLKRKVYFSNCLFEAIYTAGEGMTLGYEKRQELYIPVLDREENPNKKQVEADCKMMEEYLATYKTVFEKKRYSVEKADPDFVYQLFKKFMGKPTEAELDAYGESLFSDDVLEGNLKKVAADLSDDDIRRQRFFRKAMIMLGKRKETIRESAWMEGSIIKNGKHVCSNLFHAVLYKYFVYLRKMMKK